MLDEYCANFDGRQFRLEPSGIYEALNFALTKVCGEYVVFLHSDDAFASPYILFKLHEALKDRRVDMLYADINYVRRSSPDIVIRQWISGEFNARKLAMGWAPPHTGTVTATKIYRKSCGFDLRYKVSADYDFMLKILTNPKHQITYLPLLMTEMMTGGASNNSINGIVKKSREDFRIIRGHKTLSMATLFLKKVRKLGQFWGGF